MKKVTPKLKNFTIASLKPLFLFVLVVISINAYKLSCRIDFNVKGLENKKIFFAYEYGIKEIVLDTIKLDKEGKGFYSSKNRLTGGIYVVVFPNNKYIEFLINEEQFFTINSDTSDLFNNITIEGSEESELFRQYQVLAKEYENCVKKDQTLLKKNDTLFGKPVPDKKLVELRKKMDAFSEKILIERPKSFMAVYLRMQKDPQVPENLVYKNPELSREFILNRYKYSKAHYFDNIPFSDIRILRTRLIFEKLDHYFNYFISQDADSLISAMNNVIILSKVNEESLHFTLNFLNINYRNPKNPSQEKAFVYLADNYYLDGNSKWADANFLKLLKIKVDNLRTTMIGNTAPDLELNASNGKTVKVHDIQSDYLVIYFWSPDCNECKTETPELFNFYDKYKNKGLKVIAVYTHTDKEIWNAYLNDHKFDWINAYDPLLKSNFTKLYNVKNIPKLFLLDKDKRILAKDINISQLELLFRKKIKE